MNVLYRPFTAESSEKIIELIGHNHQVTIKELAILLKISTRTVEKNIAKLKSVCPIP